MKTQNKLKGLHCLALALLLPWTAVLADHEVRGIYPDGGTTFNLYAYPFYMNLPEGSSLYMWGFGDMNAGANASHPEGDGYNLPQYPAPTLIVDQGSDITINLTNFGVPDPVSLVIAGHQLTASGGSAGLVTNAANPNETVSYTFTASEPGTYVYHSLNGANPGLHAEMGLQGVMIVRPAGFDQVANRVAYEESGTGYDQEFLYLLTEIDPEIHFQMERGHRNHFTNSDRYAKIWFVNGRVFPDLFQGNYNGLFPHQPYQALAMTHPGDRVLVREVNAGHDSHPFHHHGENLRFVARDGRVMSSDGLTADLGRSDNTLNSAPKQSVDMIWTWTGKDLNWDIYGPEGNVAHPACCTDAVDNRTGAAGPDGYDDASWEWVADHGKPLPVTLPGVQDLTLGGWWSGSPFLGDVGALPPGEGGLNPFGGYFLVWHSHAEKELTTFDIFPGGSLSAVVVLPPDVAFD
ncbi:MAG: multicopper oxidase domain-containing protein [Gammaproteobacteria bacterium]|nr:multicopper oxidase domain-containing protein [Gammaproteobacteria bacterium]MDH4253917.1 multicopper oxidase domain-containing protein [Gammaproteobacteria bacterium]MDH5310697.1 multicopper oxidase domain-containing protein [Gammaproteobacteria bacterium]